MENQKTFYPNVRGIEWMMTAIYVVIVCSGTGLMWIREELTHDRWINFMQFGLLYILMCTLLSVSIRNQRIELTEKEIRLILLGYVRQKIKLEHINEVGMGKMNGSPVVKISVSNRTSPAYVPFLPFEKDWDTIAAYMKDQNKQIKIEL